ncbi:TRAP transporter small permease protein [Aureimonas sp. SA4125]|uniref:TRAP transporter small permease subunit n=1 Tax=Aureimonas sp. SA4125 TaxID=2826993 RepID=UPI001CC46BEB|nr:TRAP transporter small permease [Aureimonas sp. SA4125]BDA85136.1 TRAP transporter small permease protein [Aureimonas sp. SA4125]
MRTNPLQTYLGPPARIFALVGGYAILALALVITCEVLVRRFFNFSLQGGDEFGGYVLAVVAAFGFAYAWLERAHTRVELVLERLPPGLRSFLDLLSVLSIAAMAIFMAWRGFTTLTESIDYGSLSGTPMMTPLWQPQAVWVAGLLFFALVASATAVQACLLFLRRSPLLADWYGVKSLNEEIREHAAQLAERSARS